MRERITRPFHWLAARVSPALSRGRRRLARAPDPLHPVVTPKLALLAGLCLVATLLAGLADTALLHYARTHDDGALRLMRAITDIGLSQWYLVPAAATLIVVLLADWSVRAVKEQARLLAMFSHAAFIFATIALSGLLTNLIKIAVGRSRPIRFDEVGAYQLDLWSFGYANASFPSGHATTMGAVTAILCLWFPAFAFPLTVLGLFLAVTRIAAQAHYASDVAAGFSLGLLFVIVCARYLAARRTVFRPLADRLLPGVIVPGRPSKFA